MTSFYEGTEKRLEVIFQVNHQSGLTSYSRDDWAQLLTLAKCTILSQIKTVIFTSYLLSESSLFVYNDRVIIKTCGTTMPLNILNPLIDMAKLIGLTPAQIIYSHNVFLDPSRQPYPYNSFDQELKVLGSTSDNAATAAAESWLNLESCWYGYSRILTSGIERSPMLEIIMTELNPQIMNKFYKTYPSEAHYTHDLFIFPELPNPIIDCYQFDPCGFSLNAHVDQGYYTIHITPEPQFSYVSFETNVKLTDYSKLIQKVISTFQPDKVNIITAQPNFITLPNQLCGLTQVKQSSLVMGSNYSFHQFYRVYSTKIS